MLHGQTYRCRLDILCIILGKYISLIEYVFNFEIEQNKRWVSLKLDYKILKCDQPLKWFSPSRSSSVKFAIAD